MTEVSLAPAVVIPTWRRPEHLVAALEGIGRQTLRPSTVLIVGRDEDAAARAAVESFVGRLPVRWISVREPGHVAPLRAALPHINAPTFAMIDDDCVPVDGWLEALVKPLNSEGTACVGGRVIWRGYDGSLNLGANTITWYGRLKPLRAPTPSRRVNAVAEGNWAWRTAVLRRLSFDPTLDFEDALLYGVDLALQAQRLGYGVTYEPDAAVEDASAPRETLDRSDVARRLFCYNRNLAYLHYKHYSRPLRALEVGWRTVVGARAHYGAVTLAVDLATSRRKGLLVRLRASYSGIRAGRRAWRAGHTGGGSLARPRVGVLRRYS